MHIYVYMARYKWDRAVCVCYLVKVLVLKSIRKEYNSTLSCSDSDGNSFDPSISISG